MKSTPKQRGGFFVVLFPQYKDNAFNSYTQIIFFTQNLSIYSKYCVKFGKFVHF